MNLIGTTLLFSSFCFLVSFSCLLLIQLIKWDCQKMQHCFFCSLLQCKHKRNVTVKGKNIRGRSKGFLSSFFLLHFFFKTKEFLFQGKGFINVESRLASIMKGMINPFLVVLGLTDLPKLGGRGQPPTPWCLWPCLHVAHYGKNNYCDIREKKSWLKNNCSPTNLLSSQLRPLIYTGLFR